MGKTPQNRPRALVSLMPGGYRLSMSAGAGVFFGGGGVRGRVRGWTSAMRRRCRDYLCSLDADILLHENAVFMFSFSCADYLTAPQSAAFIKVFGDYIGKRGGGLFHVKEWQERGAVHLHGFCYGIPYWRVSRLWLQWCLKNKIRVSRSYGARVKRIYSWRGMAHYLTAHSIGKAAKSQRIAPPSWAGGVRLWGASKSLEKFRRAYYFEIPASHFSRYRRALVRASAAAVKNAVYTAPKALREFVDDLELSPEYRRRVFENKILKPLVLKSRRIRGIRSMKRHRTSFAPVAGFLPFAITTRLFADYL